MPTFGVHAFVWNGDWNNTIAPTTIRQSAEAGYDLLEIPLLRPTELDAGMIHQHLKTHGLQAACSLALPRELHLPAHPREALQFLKTAVDVTEAIGTTRLCGCLYCHLGTLTGAPPTSAELSLCAEVIGEVADYAAARGIQLGLEPVNRYETYLLNVGSDTVALIERIGRDNLFVHFDTYHMAIEEQGYAAPIQETGDRCGYIHLSESGRGIPGQGNVDWDDVFAGLKAIDFRGPLVLEAFAAVNPDLTAATCMWRPSRYTPHEIATQGLEFLRAKAEAYQLA